MSEGHIESRIAEWKVEYALDPNRCFLCGIPLTRRNHAEEHIFPKWLLNQLDLWDQKLGLLNGTTIPYRHVKVPCCRTCNTVHLERLESQVRRAWEGGYKAFRVLDEATIYKWLLKVFYAILIMEARLLEDRRAGKHAGAIVTRELARGLMTCHIHLQSIIHPSRFHCPPPWSIFVAKSHTYYDVKKNFDMQDSVLAVRRKGDSEEWDAKGSFCIAVRMGEVGVIGCLQDNNYQAQLLADFWRKLHGIALHPLQFTELVAKTFYKNTLLSVCPRYITRSSSHGSIDYFSISLDALTVDDVYEDWNMLHYAQLFVQMLIARGANVKLDDIYKEPGLVTSWVEREDGSINVMDSDGNPVRKSKQ